MGPRRILGELIAWSRSFVRRLSTQGRARHRPGPCARQDGGGILTAPMSVRARSSCSVLDALRALPPFLGLEAALAHRWSVLATRNPLLLFRFVVCSARPRTDGGRASPCCGWPSGGSAGCCSRNRRGGHGRKGDDAGTMGACTKARGRKQAEVSEAATIIAADPATSRCSRGQKYREPASRGDEEKKLIKDQFPEERCAADAASP